MRLDPLRSRNITDDQQMPSAPPASLRGEYLRLSQGYVRWCVGMLAWSILCVGYFILTRQMLEMAIGLCLGVLLLAMIFSPAALFGGRTWYKRLRWITVLTGLFSLLFAYPMIVVILGLKQRLEIGRYDAWLSRNDAWHLVLSLLTVLVSVWTIHLAAHTIALVRRLHYGQYESLP